MVQASLGWVLLDASSEDSETDSVISETDDQNLYGVRDGRAIILLISAVSYWHCSWMTVTCPMSATYH